MAKKFGKFLLFTAAAGAVAAAAYFYMQKKDSASRSEDMDDDFDDFTDDLDDDVSRSYVSLTPEQEAGEASDAAADFTPLAEQIAKQSEEAPAEMVEEFFDEEDDADVEPEISDI